MFPIVTWTISSFFTWSWHYRFFFITECIYGTTIWNCGWWHGEGAVEYFRINYIFLSVTAHTDSPCVIFLPPYTFVSLTILHSYCRIFIFILSCAKYLSSVLTRPSYQFSKSFPPNQSPSPCNPGPNIKCFSHYPKQHDGYLEWNRFF